MRTFYQSSSSGSSKAQQVSGIFSHRYHRGCNVHTRMLSHARYRHSPRTPSSVLSSLFSLFLSCMGEEPAQLSPAQHARARLPKELPAVMAIMPAPASGRLRLTCTLYLEVLGIASTPPASVTDDSTPSNYHPQEPLSCAPLPLCAHSSPQQEVERTPTLLQDWLRQRLVTPHASPLAPY